MTYTVSATIGSAAAYGSFNNTATTTLPNGFVQGTGSATSTASVSVNRRPPTLTAASPNTADRGKTTAVTLTGSNLTAASAVTISPATGTSFTCAIQGGGTDTSVTANCNVPASAVQGTGTIGITIPTPGGGTATVPFTLNTPTYLITSVVVTGTQNAFATRGNGSGGTNNVALTITGSGLTGSTGVTLPPSSGTANNITCSSVTAVSDTSVTATCPINYNVARGAGSIYVTTPLGDTSPLTFTVNAGTPTITSVTPNSVVKGYLGGPTVTYRETVTGTYLYEASAMGISNSAIQGSCGAVTVVSDTQAYAGCSENVLAGNPRTITLTTPGGTTATGVSVATAATVGTNISGTLQIPRGSSTPGYVEVTFTAGGGLSGVSAVTLFNTSLVGGGTVTSVTCTPQAGGTDTSLTVRCSSNVTAGVAANANRVFRLVLGGNNSGTIQTGTVTVQLL